MHVTREPIVETIPIKDLRPTQITVGMREVAEKRKQWREQKGRKGGELLGHHMFLSCSGPIGETM